METGSIKIINEEGRAPSVEAELVRGTIFLTKYEIAKLFNCFPQKVEANLRSIFKSRLLWESDVTYTHRYIYKEIERQCIYYNMVWGKERNVHIFIIQKHSETIMNKVFS